jgi:hypothetical protein
MNTTTNTMIDTTTSAQNWIAPTDTRKGIARNDEFNLALGSTLDAFADVLTYGDSKPGTIEHDILMSEAEARCSHQHDALYALLDSLLEAARLEGMATVTEALRNR